MKLIFILVVLVISIIADASPQGIPVESTFTCGLTSQQFIPYNQFRGYLLFQNQGGDATGHCHMKAGSAIVSSEGLWVNQNQNYEPVESFIKAPWFCKCDSAGQIIEILQSNY